MNMTATHSDAPIKDSDLYLKKDKFRKRRHDGESIGANLTSDSI